MRAARLDRFRGMACIESCVGGILKLLKKTYVAAAIFNMREFLGRAGPARLRFLGLGGPDT